MFDWFDESRFICRLPDLFQFYLNQWKHIHVLFKFQLQTTLIIVFPFYSLTLMFKLATIRYPANYYPVKSGIW